MLKKTLYYSILLILVIGLLGAGNLVLEELNTGKGCPKIMHIPMCIVILICIIIPFATHLLKKWKEIYFLFTGIAGTIALIASIMQFTGNTECPKTTSGTPMCYYSLLIFSSLIILKYYYLKLNKKK